MNRNNAPRDTGARSITNDYGRTQEEILLLWKGDVLLPPGVELFAVSWVERAFRCCPRALVFGNEEVWGRNLPLLLNLSNRGGRKTR